jgi:hypothetical protein
LYASKGITRAYAAGLHNRFDLLAVRSSHPVHLSPPFGIFLLLLYTTGIICAPADAVRISLTVGLGCDGSMIQRAASEQVGRASGLSKWGCLLLVQHGEPAPLAYCGPPLYHSKENPNPPQRQNIVLPQSVQQGTLTNRERYRGGGSGGAMQAADAATARRGGGPTRARRGADG